MNNSFKTGQFEGPLDLLLNLITEQKLNISEIALSEVTEQFLQYLNTIDEKQPEDLADFLVVATRLLLLKSKNLLPQFGVDEEEGPSLEEQLRLYKAFVEASKKMNKAWLSTRRAVFRVEPPRLPEEFVGPDNFSFATLRQSMDKLLYKLTPPKPLPQINIDKTISLKEKIFQISSWLKSNKTASFSQMLNNSKNRTEVIIGFLALLELVKQKTISLEQNDNFSDILINRV